MLRARCLRSWEQEVTETAYRFAAKVGPEGKLELNVPVPAGTSVEVVIFAPQTDEAGDLLHAAQSGLAFWENPQDDADWNDA